MRPGPDGGAVTKRAVDVSTVCLIRRSAEFMIYGF